MRILVLTQEYPSTNFIYKNHYVHTRLKTYINEGHSVIVLSFSEKNEYVFENINVKSRKKFKESFSVSEFDVVIVHAPNLRNHFRFLLLNNLYKKVVFVIHGHEVLKRSNYYPEPFDFMKSKYYPIKKWFNNFYDYFKLKYLKSYFEKGISRGKFSFIFVSQWMKDEFLRNIKLSKNQLEHLSNIIPNPIGEEFLNNSYDATSDKVADFITIRPIDRSKHSIDIVKTIAVKNPNKIFHVYGEGNYFKHNEQPENLIVFSEFIHHSKLPEILNKYKCALMPTRLDSQGVMMCEMATYGIPVVTSNLPICNEMLSEFNNICFINNNDIIFNADTFINSISNFGVNKSKFSSEKTILKEIKFIDRIVNN